MTQTNPSLFVVDDEKVLLTYMAKVLSVLPVDIRTYTDPEEAWNHLSEYHPCIVLLDLNMPKLDGKSWMVRLSEERKMNNFHLVVVTANLRDEAMAFGLYSMGAVEVIRKPVDPDELLALVQELLEDVPE